MVSNIFLALGSNLGDRFEFFRKVISKINKDKSCRVLKCSSIYETTPYGEVDQPNFINAVIEIETDYNPHELLKYVKNMEKEIGRTPKVKKWGQREIDVDIIFYNDVIYTGDKMIIPHPECLKRDFVMAPLLEIAPNFVYPGLKKEIREFGLSALEKHIIRKIDFPINK